MRIALIYPPPWKIPGPGQPLSLNGDGPPAEFQPGDLDSDFFETPYGLFTLGAQALRAGHQVKVINLSSFEWARVEEVVERLDADLWGMSCWTANRRGVALLARSIKKHHPGAFIVIGGPHATPFASEMLTHYPEIDLVTLGESEATFMELVERLEHHGSAQGLAGTVYRSAGKVKNGPSRAAIHDLDSLASPHGYFDTHIVMTSRGCPWACTFCGAETTWGRGFRGHAVPYVLDALEQALQRVPVKMLQIKDDTFTTNRKRVVTLCRGIRERRLNFFWSCDTRVDVLSEELLYEMRLAGCQRMSLGVESGSQRILDNIDKKITVDEILASTEMAKKFGIQLRFYMMLGNRGETAETFHETLEFLQAARPHQYIFSCLSIYPGTRDFQAAEKAGWLDRELFFKGDFQELKVPFDASEEDTALMSDWFSKNKGIQNYYREGVDECKATLSRLGDYHAAHMDLGGAYYREGQFDAAQFHVSKALELGYPAPGLAYNYLACIALARGDVQSMQDHLLHAARLDPQHYVLIQNARAAREWFKNGGPAKKLPLELGAHHDFQLLERTAQPSLPGPLDENFAEWDAPESVRSGEAGYPAGDYVTDPSAVMLEAHDTVGFKSRRLPVVG
jgi:radical SAM superfamily enzyme YgiQ (UPF0313 family)